MPSTVVLVALGAAAACLLFVKARSRRRGGAGSGRGDSGPGRPSVEGGEGVGFGSKCAWLAVRTEAPQTVMRALRLGGVKEVGWAEGVEAAYSGAVFVTSPIQGWVLVASTALPAFGDDGAASPSELIRRLSEALATEVHYFGTHRVVEYHAWALARTGRVERAFAWLGERGEVLVDEGERREGEPAVEVAEEAPDEGVVMRIAGAWSLDPSRLGADGTLGSGWMGRLA